MPTYAVFGTDARQTWLRVLLREAGKTVLPGSVPDGYADTVILPIPSVTKDGLICGSERLLSDYLKYAPDGISVWGSGIVRFQSAAQHIRLHDFTRYERFAAENAVPTAEGAIGIAMQELPVTICGGRFLVIGFGRIGRCLAQRLADLGGTVTVARRVPCTLPYRTDITGSYLYPLSEYDTIFNTVPTEVLNAEQCGQTRADCVLIDLASVPGGICKTGGRAVIHALGLPAAAAPKTAAAILRNILLTETEEPT